MRDFIVHLDNLAGFEILTNEEKGLLFSSMVEYARDGTEPTFEDRTLLIVWLNLKKKMDLDFASYDETLRKRSEAGKASGEARRTKAKSVEQNEHMLTSVQSVEQNATNGTKPKLKPKPKLNNINNICAADAASAVVDKSDSTHDVEDESDKVPYREIIEYLNQKLGTHYLPKSKDTRKAIHARWAEGYRLEDFKKVIDNMAARWGKDSKMVEYLRPITLFSPKFESYLNLKTQPQQNNSFRNFEERDIDFDSLEAQLDRQFSEGMA